MKFKIILAIFFLNSCSVDTLQNKKTDYIPYSSKGFALIYNENDFKDKIISSKLNEDKLSVGHDKIKKNSIIVITNPENNKSITLRVSKKVNYPDFFKVLITQQISEKLELNNEYPYVDVQERIKNKSFVAKKAVTYSEEKKVLIKVPVTKVKIDNISKKKNEKQTKKTNNKYSIVIGDFYSASPANTLIDLLVKEDIKREVLMVNKLKKNKYQLTAGPYYSVYTLKNDYFKLNKYGFHNLDIKKND